MVLKNVFPALLGAALLASSVALAAGYRPDQYFGLDLSRAALSPTPLGPPTQFALRRKRNSDQTAATAEAGAALIPQPKKVALERISASPPRKVAGVGAAAQRGPMRTRWRAGAPPRAMRWPGFRRSGRGRAIPASAASAFGGSRRRVVDGPTNLILI
jgi:hypothetical protein